MNRAKRKIKAEETVKILERGYYFTSEENKVSINNETENAIKNTVLYSPEELEEISNSVTTDNNFNTDIQITNEDSISAILRLKEEEINTIMCLNFASAKNPGGGFLNGSLAQEESLAVSSALHKCQTSSFSYYEKHRKMKSCMYTDTMIHSPKVPVFRNNKMELLEKYKLCGFITSAAVNYGVVKKEEPHLAGEVVAVMDKRIEKLLSLSLKEGYDSLILGAWGCGVFQNDPEVIATLFKKHLKGKFKNSFKKVVFAIYSKREKFISAFENVFEE